MKCRALLVMAFALGITPAHAQYGGGGGMEPRIYTGLWWNPAEPGWGVNTAHQGNILFATLFTYAADGQPLWLVASNLSRTVTGGYGMDDYEIGSFTYAGPLYRTTGPAFDASPWTSFGYTQVGTMTFEFYTPTDGMLTYTFEGATVVKAIQRQVFALPVPECVAVAGSRAVEGNYQDLWWNPAESGWGINLAHQGAVIFATLFTYGSSGRDTWFVASNLAREPDGSFTGALYSTTGPAFNSVPWQPFDYDEVGRMGLRFTDGENATLTYNVGAAMVTKQIRRQVFAATPSACR